MRLVVVADLAARSSRDLVREIPAILRLLSVLSQYTHSRKMAADSAGGNVRAITARGQSGIYIEP